MDNLVYGTEQPRRAHFEDKENKDLKVRKVWVWNIPGKDLKPWMISFLLFCSEIRSSDIIKPNITREMNWLVYACDEMVVLAEPGQEAGPWAPVASPPPALGTHGSFYLGAGHADLWSRVDVDPAVSLSGDGAAHSVGDAHGQRPPVFTVTQRQEGVSRLACHMGPASQCRAHRRVALPALTPSAPASRLLYSLLLSKNWGPDTAGCAQKGKCTLSNFCGCFLDSSFASISAESTFSPTASPNDHSNSMGATLSPFPAEDEVPQRQRKSMPLLLKAMPLRAGTVQVGLAPSVPLGLLTASFTTC